MHWVRANQVLKLPAILMLALVWCDSAATPWMLWFHSNIEVTCKNATVSSRYCAEPSMDMLPYTFGPQLKALGHDS